MHNLPAAAYGRRADRIISVTDIKNVGAKFTLLRRGAPRGTRTPDLLVRSQSLYPAELLAHVSLNIISQKKEFVNVISKKNIFFLFEIKNNRPQYRGLL